jgi:hypothetical protein
MRIVTVGMAGALLGGAILLLPPGVAAQSLGEAAERARKERKGKPAKVITETDLRRAGTAEAPVAAAETSETSEAPAKEGTAAAAPAKEKTEEELRAEAEAAWRQRLQKAREDVTRLNAEAAQLQTSLNDLSQNLYGTTRTGMMSRLEEVKKQLSAAQQSVSDLEEEGRRSRYRP